MRMRRLAAALVAASLAFAPAVQAQTIILVRHAERADASADPDLSPAGQIRARALAEALRDAKLTAVLASTFKRTQQTARPAAEAAKLPVTPISSEGGGPAHIQRVTAVARQAGPGDAVLVVGHSNTVPDIARALGDPSPPVLTDCDYDTLTIIQLGGAQPRVIHARYGEPTKAC